ncbi:MAG TPA: alpha/beta hydrolase [Rhizomicrobium sp.]|jgi:pimeloyl-ACP methyl ester carboxylesterase|nr:alpha/beta hydrolase [Rhizomicrobium sp.]
MDNSAVWRSPDLGTQREITLAQGTIRYWERGQGAPIVFAHGWLANANLWRKIVVPLAKDFRCIVPDLPFGSHLLPLNENADLTPAGCGALIADFIAALGLNDATLVGNDSGGAYSQIATAAHPERIGRLVLNSCETPYDQFPPPAFIGLKQAAQSDEVLGNALQVLRDRGFRKTPQGYGFLIKHPIDDAASDSYALPILSDGRILRDAAKAMRSASETYVQAAGQKLIAGFDKPVLFLWSPEDKFFPLESARRYAGELARARVELIEDAYSFTPEDQPEILARHIAAFCRE